MKLATEIPVRVDYPDGCHENIVFPREEYVTHRRACRAMGLPPFHEGGFIEMVRQGLRVMRSRRIAGDVK